jgi:hypothetical protein
MSASVQHHAVSRQSGRPRKKGIEKEERRNKGRRERGNMD